MSEILQGATAKAYIDLTGEQLVEHALRNKEGVLSSNGAITVTTGSRTGRSPKDKFYVYDDKTAHSIDWGEVNQSISSEKFDALWEKATAFLKQRAHYVSHLQVGADQRYSLPVKVMTELAWHNLFAQNLFIKPVNTHFDENKAWTIVNTPGLAAQPAQDGTHSDAAVIINFSKRCVLITGVYYAGEMKKAMFSVLNYQLPEQQVLPMHCSANVGEQGDVALFFGLSGTGKTTLSADPKRYLIGDDEHGWSHEGIFNFEGGCYAKCIDLSAENEPFIHQAIRRGAIMENVVLDAEGAPNYSDDSLTQNTRAAYPLTHIKKRIKENQAGSPNAVIFLTCDLYGVLPPVALLSKEQAAYHFLSGYTALVGSTEVGSQAGIRPTFSTCFGAPFFPHKPTVYAELLIRHIEKTGCQTYLVNTGWTGGAFGQGGQRFSIPVTRCIIDAILSGELHNAETEVLAGFNLTIPRHVSQVPSELLNPRNTWRSAEEYNKQLAILCDEFNQNFKKFDVSVDIRAAGPHLD